MAKGSSATSDESSDGSVREFQAPRKRKPTYLVRKEEEKALKDEIMELQAQVAVLQTKGMPVDAAIAADPVLQQSTAKWKVLHDTVKNQHLGVAAAQSLMMEITNVVPLHEQRTQYSHPLCSRIHLKEDWGERRATLLAIRDEKLKNAFDYVTARCSYSADEPGQESNEQFETDDGDVCFAGNCVLRFPGVQSLEQVFEALRFYLNNMEISISERLGHITVREDYDTIDGSIYNARILSSNGNGITTESNTVVIMQLFGKEDPRFGGESCAIVASDCVDEDELYPYRPSEHVRKDVSGGIVLTEQRSEGSEDVVVTMRRSGFLKLHRPEFPISPSAQQELEAGIADWGTVMIKAMREILYAGN